MSAVRVLTDSSASPVHGATSIGPAAVGVVRHSGRTLNRRSRLKILDACLGALEDAHETGNTTVPNEVVRRFGALVEGLTSEMPIVDALEVVFAQQGRLMMTDPAAPGLMDRVRVINGGQEASHGASRRSRPPTVTSELLTDAGGTLSATEARTLTDQIKSNLHQASLLLLAAYRGNAWTGLRYGTWAQYVRAEFGLSRSRSYELLEHGRVIRALQLAAETSGTPDISPFAAEQIKSELPEIVSEVNNRTAGAAPKRKLEVIAEIIHEHRLRHRLSRESGVAAQKCAPYESSVFSEDRLVDEFGEDVHLDRLFSAIELLSVLPSPATVADRVPSSDEGRLQRLDRAAQWLVGFSEQWTRRCAASQQV